MYAPAQNTIARPRPAYFGAWKLAICASLSLAITLLSAHLINHSVVQAYTLAAQPSPVQLVVPLIPGTPAPVPSAITWHRV